MSDDSHTPQGASDGQHETAPTQGQQVVTLSLSKHSSSVDYYTCPLCDTETGQVKSHMTRNHPEVKEWQLEVSDLVATDQEATTPPLKSAPNPLPKDNQIEPILNIVFSAARSREPRYDTIMAAKAALDTAIRHSLPEKLQQFKTAGHMTRTRMPSEVVGFNNALDQFVDALRGLGIEIVE